MKMLKSTLFIFLTLTSISLFAQKKVEISYNFESGKTYKTEMSMVQTIAMEVQGQDMDLDQTMKFFFGTKIVEAYKDSFKIEVTIDRVKMNQKIMGMDMNYDSDSVNTADPMSAQIHAGFQAILGKSIIQVIDKKGNSLRIDLGELAGNPQLNQSLGNIGQYIVFPDGPIKIGESFEQDMQQLAETGVKNNMTYTLEKIENNIAFFHVDGVITSSEEEGGEMNMEMEGTQSGTIKIDTKTGWQMGGTIDQQMEMVINQQGMSIPAQVQGTITYVTK